MDPSFAILLEPTVSKSWRKYLVRGLETLNIPMQHGGRKVVHLLIRLWHSHAKACKKALGIAFVDIKSTFYSVFKPMLASFNGTMEPVAAVFRDLRLPHSAFQNFMQNVGASDLIRTATASELVEGHV